MPVIVVGGSGRGVGKTLFVCELVEAFPSLDWTAVKISSHPHGRGSPLWEERNRGEDNDTGRYLTAGARRALLVTSDVERFPAAALQNAIGADTNLIFESNRKLELWKPDLRVAVCGSARTVWKPSFEEFVESADALVVPTGLQEMSLPGKAVFSWGDDARISADMNAWLRGRLLV